jgi:pyridoxine/pyridoxamine 5'-phosphate oxidase
MLIKASYRPEEVWRDLVHELKRAARDRKHSMRSFVLSTQAPQGPDACYVVLRHCTDEPALLFYTDARSAKHQHLQQRAQTCSVFYHPRQRFQLRCYARAICHQGDELAQKYWQEVPPPGRKAYTPDQAPGTPLSTPEVAHQWSQPHDGKYFTVVELLPHQWDVLQLDGGAHRRLVFTRAGASWEGRWVAP